MNLPMDLERLQALAAAHGGDPARWPAPEREAALRLLEASAAARAALQSARALDALIALPAPPPPAPALRAAVLRTAPRERAAGWSAAWSWRLALPALAMSVALGVGLGLASAPAAQAEPGDEEVLALAQIDDVYAEYAEP